MNSIEIDNSQTYQILHRDLSETKSAAPSLCTWENIVSAIRYSYRKGTGRPTMDAAHSFRLALQKQKKKTNQKNKKIKTCNSKYDSRKWPANLLHPDLV